MTIKQEIIDMVELILEGGIDNGLRTVLTMLHRLKPEIKVKKLVWKHDPNFDENTICAHVFDLFELNLTFVISQYPDQYELSVWQELRGTEVEKKLVKFTTLEEAQDQAQRFLNEYVLSLVEVSDEN